MKVLTTTQRDEAWYAARLGMLTASSIGSALKKGVKGNYLSGRADLIQELAMERLYGVCEPVFESWEMKQGQLHETAALAAVEVLTGEVVTPVGLLAHESIPGFGGSPDGLIDVVAKDEKTWTASGCVEVKWRKPAIHAELLRSVSAGDRRIIPDIHFAQCLAHLSNTGCEYLVYGSYQPRAPEAQRLICVRMNRGDWIDEIKQLEDDARVILSEVSKAHAELQTIRCESLLIARK